MVELITVGKFDAWLVDRMHGLRCGDDAKAYVVGVLNRYERAASEIDLGRESITLAFLDAKLHGSFAAYQRIGDWTLWASSMRPLMERPRRELIETFGRLSYYACHRIIRGQLAVYEELADELPAITYDVRCNLR